MAELFAPFSKVAAKNPFSSSPVERSVEEIITVTDDNRMICDPYPRLLVARDQVNQGAAALLMSVEAARRLGVPEEKWVYLHGHADMVEQGLLDRADLGASPAAVHGGARSACGWPESASTTSPPSICTAASRSRCSSSATALGIGGDDPRGLTLTGGLPYFGGPGNSYSLHAIAETVCEMRDKPGQFGLVGANGGIMSKYSVGVYSTEPVDWAHRPQRGAEGGDRCAAEGARDQRPPTAPRRSRPTRCATTGRCAPGSSSAGSMPTASRFMATTEDEDLVALMSDGDPLGAAISRLVNRARQPRHARPSRRARVTGSQTSAASLPASRST